ncbi:MAG: hypothetical protein NZ529_09150 [Cytophagaceae bacterium]|nr:hypothetical protein [Cytophagaceae bacterium]MDW8456950.1 hypothetical protein [Cytophagaceae bacterium]
MNGKVISIISYITLFGWLIAFLLYVSDNKKEPLASYHLKQSLGLALIELLSSLILLRLFPMSIRFLSFAFLVLLIIGIYNAAMGEKKPLPLIGKWFDEWFKGI